MTEVESAEMRTGSAGPSRTSEKPEFALATAFGRQRRGVEQWQLASLLTRRSNPAPRDVCVSDARCSIGGLLTSGLAKLGGARLPGYRASPPQCTLKTSDNCIVGASQPPVRLSVHPSLSTATERADGRLEKTITTGAGAGSGVTRSATGNRNSSPGLLKRRAKGPTTKMECGPSPPHGERRYGVLGCFMIAPGGIVKVYVYEEEGAAELEQLISKLNPDLQAPEKTDWDFTLGEE